MEERLALESLRFLKAICMKVIGTVISQTVKDRRPGLMASNIADSTVMGRNMVKAKRNTKMVGSMLANSLTTSMTVAA